VTLTCYVFYVEYIIYFMTSTLFAHSLSFSSSHDGVGFGLSLIWGGIYKEPILTEVKFSKFYCRPRSEFYRNPLSDALRGMAQDIFDSRYWPCFKRISMSARLYSILIDRRLILRCRRVWSGCACFSKWTSGERNSEPSDSVNGRGFLDLSQPQKHERDFTWWI
jgi:hypothetical protein